MRDETRSNRVEVASAQILHASVFAVNLVIDLIHVTDEYCFNAGLGRGGRMTHYGASPTSRTEDVIDFVNAQPLFDAGMPADRLPAFPGGLESMKPTQCTTRQLTS